MWVTTNYKGERQVWYSENAIQEVCRNILNKYSDHSLGTVNYANLFLSKINEVIK